MVSLNYSCGFGLSHRDRTTRFLNTVFTTHIETGWLTCKYLCSTRYFLRETFCVNFEKFVAPNDVGQAEAGSIVPLRMAHSARGDA